jgi:hypothetical protein
MTHCSFGFPGMEEMVLNAEIIDDLMNKKDPTAQRF